MTWVLILGLIINAIALPLAAKRVLFLERLITNGQPAPDRIHGVTGRLGSAIGTQIIKVFGQKKLLKWSVPGVAHFMVFWAFLTLGSVYVEAYGTLFTFLTTRDLRLVYFDGGSANKFGGAVDTQLWRGGVRPARRLAWRAGPVRQDVRVCGSPGRLG